MKAHPRFVRVTHWTHTVSFLALVVSGVAILLAHPRLYWGESGAFGSPSLVDLPLPLSLDQSGWGRSLHFLAAWICVLNGALYVTIGLIRGHFKRRMLTASTSDDVGSAFPGHRSAEREGDRRTVDDDAYNRLQRATYLVVVFVLLPLVILTGLSMSPAVMAAVPIVDLFAGHQSARTIHFVVAVALTSFLLIHIVMVSRAGVGRRMRRMITGYADA